MVILTGSMSLGQCLPNIEGIMSAGGSAINVYAIIDSVSTNPVVTSSRNLGQISRNICNVAVNKVTTLLIQVINLVIQ